MFIRNLRLDSPHDAHLAFACGVTAPEADAARGRLPRVGLARRDGLERPLPARARLLWRSLLGRTLRRSGGLLLAEARAACCVTVCVRERESSKLQSSNVFVDEFRVPER